ncbi:hypothetical protein [Pseudomonas syringae]|uniref:hypothetical protein n=1 Tax=Pseudomonas syringae TaxID=317 RepID=UPI003F7550C2
MPKAPPVPSSPLQSSPLLDLTRRADERDFAVAYRRPLFACMVESQIIQGELAMRSFGIFVLIAGIACLIYAIGMDISVPTGLGRVNNLGLMSDRSNLTLTGGIITIAGLLMVIFGRKASQPAPQEAVDTRACPFCAESIKAAAVKCRFCGADVEAAEPTALVHGWVVRIPCRPGPDVERVTTLIHASGYPMLEPDGSVLSVGAYANKQDATAVRKALGMKLALHGEVFWVKPAA